MRIALVGAGIIGTAHAGRLAALDEVESLLIADKDEKKAAAVASQVAKATPGSVDDAFKDGISGVVITTNAIFHAPLIHRALDAGIPVFTEKPVAPDVAATREVVAHSKRVPDVPVQVGFQRRFNPGYRRAREAYRSGELGFVHTAYASTFDEVPAPAAYIPTSGGLFKDNSIHDFDILAWVTGRKAVFVSAVGSDQGEKFYPEGGDMNTVNALVRYDDELTAFVSASRYNGAGADVRLELFGSKSSLFVGLDDRAPLNSAEPHVSWTKKDPYHNYRERFEDSFAAELKAFTEMARGEIESPCTPAEALEALYVSEAAMLSMKRGAPVNIAEVREW
jgi:myo-inositol 2-dehydrogenase/D-chiro-inositol 1-dehydrogenase